MRPELDDTLAAPAAPGGELDRTATAHRGDARPAVHGLPAGHQLGHFRIERPLGAGGMGEVYLATDLALDRPVAVKVLPEEVAKDPVRRDRMIREARAQARVTHPNVAHIYFIGEEQGRLYFAMELVNGKTLAERVADGPLPVEDAVAIIRAAALGLREAQRSGFTHRDVKPSNLMVDPHGMVKVLDFGLAAGAPGRAAPDAPVAQTSLAGTPLYMAPEQARGEPVDFRADIYALGATLFHLVSGRPPFEADSVEALLSKHASAERPSLPRRSGQPRTTRAAIDALCTRMMAPSAADRFASYDELLHALELASAEHTRPAGFWVRSMAVGTDFVLTSIVTLLVMLLARELGLIGPHFGTGTQAMLAYGVYMFVALARWGKTLGQSLFEIEVADVRAGTRPSLRQVAIRLAIPYGMPFGIAILDYVMDRMEYALVDPISTILVIVQVWVPLALAYAVLRTPGKRAVWDQLSGTMVRYRTRRTAT